MLPEAPQILIVDDDRVTCDLLCEVFEREGLRAAFEQSRTAALSRLTSYQADVVLSDIRMGSRVDGLTLLGDLQRDYPQTKVILMTAFGSMDTAVRAVKEGAFDYISKPFSMDAVIATVRRALSVHDGGGALGGDTDELGEPHPAINLVGRNPKMLEIFKTIARVSDARAPVLISGESGTGKELIARAIHTTGHREVAPFVAVNCGSLTETLLESELFGHVKGSFTGAIANRRGLFEQAQAGTLFLDEISETSIALQVKLLRVLQEREIVPVGGESPIKVNARVIAASNADLQKLCEAGLFRRDLYYRLNVITIELPALRERHDDIPFLVAHLIRKHTVKTGSVVQITPDALRVLCEYDWPGNVRELENVIERAITLRRSANIDVADLPETFGNRDQHSIEQKSSEPSNGTAAKDFHVQTIDELERDHILKVLELTGGNRKRAAELLGINRRTLYRMAERFGIELEL